MNQLVVVSPLQNGAQLSGQLLKRHCLLRAILPNAQLFERVKCAKVNLVQTEQSRNFNQGFKRVAVIRKQLNDIVHTGLFWQLLFFGSLPKAGRLFSLRVVGVVLVVLHGEAGLQNLLLASRLRGSH